MVGIAGLGYVGLPLMRAATQAGFRVLGFDIDQARVASLNDGRSPIRHLAHEFVRAQVSSGRFEATTDFARAGEADAILICVPTPLGPHREPDLSFVEGTVRSLAPHLRRDHLLVLESTTWPGTTREVVRPLVEATGLVVGRDIFLAYSPEREDPGNRGVRHDHDSEARRRRRGRPHWLLPPLFTTSSGRGPCRSPRPTSRRRPS